METATRPKLVQYERVHYTGDQANREGNGVIEKIENQADGITVALDDGRTFRVPACAFYSGPGQRFYLRHEWERQRATVMFSAYGIVTCTVGVSEKCWQPDGPKDAPRKECPACYDVLSA